MKALGLYEACPDNPHGNYHQEEYWMQAIL